VSCGVAWLVLVLLLAALALAAICLDSVRTGDRFGSWVTGGGSAVFAGLAFFLAGASVARASARPAPIPSIDFDACGAPRGGNHPRFVATCEVSPGRFLAWAAPDLDSDASQEDAIPAECPAGVTVPIFRLYVEGEDTVAGYTWREE
jgi:hypothetical protein